MADKEDEDDDVGSAKARADASTRANRQKMYDKSYDRLGPEEKKKFEEKTRKELTSKAYPQGKHFPNFDDVRASQEYPDPVPGPLINIYPGRMYDNPKSK